MESRDNSERLARANLRIHEIQAHEGIDAHSQEFAEQLSIQIRKGRNKP